MGDVSLGTALGAVPSVACVAAGVAVRRRTPLVAALVTAIGLGTVSLTAGAVFDALTTVYLAWGLVTYTAAVRLPTRPAIGAAAAAIAVVLVTAIGQDGTSAAQTTTGLGLFVAAPVVAGRLLRSRIAIVARLADQAAELEAQRAGRIEESVTDERVRIAGELHDIVAHALGAMTIQAAVARRMADRDAERAGAAFQAVETTGREALTELRTLMEVLRRGPREAAALEPQPGIDGLAALAERSRERGLPVGLTVTGAAPGALPRGVELTAYRVVQDALGEALARGGAGRAKVSLAYGEDALELAVVDDGTRTAGRRLVGLEERVRVCGGTVQAGARAAGGYAIQVSLPFAGVAA